MREALPILAFLLLAWLPAGAQLSVTTANTPQQLVEGLLLGQGVTATNITFNGQPGNVPNLPNIGSFGTGGNPTNLGISEGIILSTGKVMEAPGLQTFHASTNIGSGSDPDLVTISGGAINDRAVLEFDFVPIGDTVRFRYVFGSEEYPSFVCSYNDVFGFFLSGPGINGPYTNNAINIALLPGDPPTVPVTIANVNHGQGNNPNHSTCPAVNPEYYVNNSGGTSIVYNGFTVVLTAFALVTCGETYHIKLAIGDAGGPSGNDAIYDSAVFLEAGSFASSGQVLPELADGLGADSEGMTMMQGCGPFELVFTRMGDLSEEATITLNTIGTATPGVDYFPPLPLEMYFGPDVEHVSHWIDVPMDDDGPETIVVEILQMIACAGQELMTTFTFHIDSPPPLVVQDYDIDAICGDVNTLDPAVEGGMGVYEYQWSTGADTSALVVSPGITTTYTLTVSDGCAVEPVTVDYTVTLPIYLPLEVEMGPDMVIHCLEQDPIEVAQATGGDNNFTYVWTLDDAQVGTGPSIMVGASDPPVWYVVTIHDGCGSVIQDSLMVSTLELPEVLVNTAPYQQVICGGDGTTLQVVGTTGGTGVYTYEWFAQDGQMVGSGSSLDIVVDADHTYTVMATDQCASSGSIEVLTLLPVYEPFALNLSADRWICAGDSFELLAHVTGGSGYHFIEWHDLDHADPWLTVAPMEDTRYSITAIDQCGEIRTGNVTLRVEHVQVDIIETNSAQDTWYLQAATIPYGQSWVWDMGDGTRLRGPQITHRFFDLEDHWVTLRVVTPNGCVGIDSLELRAPAHVYFPSAFTPDGDGHNDTFGPVGEYITDFEMFVYDRWGRLVYESRGMENLWDGTINGSEPAPTGVYIYKYKLSGHYFAPIEGYGQVTLVQGSLEY